MKYVILGNGAAGISAVEKLRQINDSSDITVISVEDTPVYTKVMLPDYIAGKISREKLTLRDMNYYNQKGIKLLLNRSIENIDSTNKMVRLTNNSEDVGYDKLLLAVGGRPVIPSIEGLKEIKYFTLNSIKDADDIINTAKEGKNAVIVGAGLTGIEIAFALKRLGMEVVLVERETRILPQQLDATAAEMLVEMIRKEGIELILGSSVQSVKNENGLNIELSIGEKIRYDMLVISIGTRPDLAVVSGTGIKTNRGVLVNDYMETNIKDIYAAGDVAELENSGNFGTVSSYIWPNALAQGKCAASNMAGQVQQFSPDAGLSNAIRLRDVSLLSMGMINPIEEEYETLTYRDEDSHTYRKVVLRDNIIKGLILLGDTSSGSILGDFIRKGRSIYDIRDIILEKDFAVRYKNMV